MKRALSILLAALLLLFAVPTVAEEEKLQAGLYVSDSASEMMYLYEEGVGVLICAIGGQLYCNGVIWTEDSLEVERTRVPFAATDGALSFTYGDSVRQLRQMGPKEGFDLGDRNGTAFAGEYAAQDGKALSLTADGRGVYTDESGETNVFWGSYEPYFAGEGVETGACYILFDSYLSNLTFTDDQAVLTTEAGEEVTFARVAPAEAPEPEEATMTVVSRAFDLCVTLPTDRWVVEETEGGLRIYRQKDLIQYTFLSLPLEEEPTAATLDSYTDHIWANALTGVTHDSTKIVRGFWTVGEAQGRWMATEWTREGALLEGDSVLWYANGRLYAALCVSTRDTRKEAVNLLFGVLMSLTPAETTAQSRENLLPVDRDAFEAIRELPEVTESVYCGYRLGSGDEFVDLIPLIIDMGMDPRTFCLTLRSDGTGTIQLMDEGIHDLTWTEDTMTVNGESVACTWIGDHIFIIEGNEIIEFAPVAEIEALLAAQTAENPAGSDPVAATIEALIGTWTFTKARAMGMEIPASMMGTEMSLVLNEDGSAVLLTDGSPTEMAWVVRGDGKVSLTMEDTESFSLTYDGTVLTLGTGSEAVEMIFEKN